MADLEQLETPAGEVPPQTTEEDPAAAFLAREQDELAGIEDDNFGIDSTPASEPAAESNDVQQNLDFFLDTAPQSNDLELDPLAGEPENKPDEDLQTNGPSDMYSAISQVDTRMNEPEKIRLWREEQKERLQQKDVDADKLEIDWQEAAKKEVTDWYTRADEQKVKAKSSNRAAEEAFIKERDEETPGQEWERIARLCDFNPKNNKNIKDVTRFRSILLHLKQTGLQQPASSQ